MNARLAKAINRLRGFPDFSEYPQFRWSNSDIETLKRSTGLNMPNDLKEVLVELGAIGLKETELYFHPRYPDGSKVESEIQIMFNPLQQVLDCHETLIVSEHFPGRLDPKYIVFGTADGGNSFLLMDGTSGESAVFFWALAFEPIGEGDNALGVAKVADSLPEFIDNLRLIDEI